MSTTLPSASCASRSRPIPLERLSPSTTEARYSSRMAPIGSNGHNCMPKALMAKHEYDAAIGELRLSVQANPTGAAEHRVLGQALLLTGKKAAAARELQIAVSLDPDSASAPPYLPIAWARLGNLSLGA